MKMFTRFLLGLAFVSVSAQSAMAACPAFLDHNYRGLHATSTVNLCEAFAGKVLLLVNTASHCGFTPQFKSLEALYQRYKDQGLAIVGFSSNDFKQESAKEEAAAEICYINYGVTFTMLAPTHVRGDEVNPTFAMLNKATQAPSWNFNKYLVSADGERIQHFGSLVAPDSSEIEAAIAFELKSSTANTNL